LMAVKDQSSSISSQKALNPLGFRKKVRITRFFNKVFAYIWKILYPLMLVLTALYLIVPTLVIVLASVSESSSVKFPPEGITLHWYLNFFSRPGLLESMLISIGLGFVVALLAVTVAVFISVRFGRRMGTMQSLVVSLVYLPLILPAIVYGPALLIWTANFGVTRSFWATALTLGAAYLVLVLPFALQSIRVGYERLDPSFEEAALIMGARPLTVFRYITLPLLMPAIIAGATFCFLISFDEPVIALFFTRVDFVTLPVRIFQYLRFKQDPTVAAIATIMIIVSMVLVVIADRFVGLGKLMGLRR